MTIWKGISKKKFNMEKEMFSLFINIRIRITFRIILIILLKNFWGSTGLLGSEEQRVVEELHAFG